MSKCNNIIFSIFKGQVMNIFSKVSILLTLACSIAPMHAMNEAPTIKAIICFADTGKNVRYATTDNLSYLAEKGLAQPTLPIVKNIAEVRVIENNKTINWLDTVPQQVRSFEQDKVKRQNLSFGKSLTANLAINNKTFPQYLPIELIQNCCNGSKITLNLGDYIVQATVQGETDLPVEHKKSMKRFFEHPKTGLSLSERDSLVESQILAKDPLTIAIGNFIPLTIDLYIHGDNGYNCNEKITKELCKKTIAAHNNSMHKFVTNRQLGMKAQRRLINDKEYAEKILSNILAETLEESNEQPQTLAEQAQEEYGRPTNGENGRHGNECQLF
jgi:hypothetical protein